MARTFLWFLATPCDIQHSTGTYTGCLVTDMDTAIRGLRPDAHTCRGYQCQKFTVTQLDTCQRVPRTDC